MDLGAGELTEGGKRIWAEGSRRSAGATTRLRMPDGAKAIAGEVGDGQAGWRRKDEEDT